MAANLYTALSADPETVTGEGDGVKILHVLGDSKFGGAAKSIIRTAQLWQSSGWDVRILTSDPVFQQAVVEAGITYTGLDCIWREIRPVKDLIGLIRLWRFLRAEPMTIVHTHTTKAGFIGRIAARLAGVPIVVHTVHGFAFHERSGWAKIAFYSLLEKIAGYCCDRIITVSRFHRQWALDLHIASAAKLRAIPNGIPDIREPRDWSLREEVRASLGIARDDVLLLTPGRLVPEKGLEDLLPALAATRGRVPRRLIAALAGDGPLLPELTRITQALGLSDQALFLGFRNDIGALLAAADMVVLPSLREGMSISLLESMSAGRAIVATSIGGNREAVGGSDPVALLVGIEDRQALADAIVRLAGDADFREDLGRRARARWEREYTIERTQIVYMETYRDLLRGCGLRERRA